MAGSDDIGRGPIDLSEESPFCVGRLQVRPSALSALADGRERSLQPRVMQVLIALAQARPEGVPRQTLIDRCWSGRTVGDDSINRCILALRHLSQEFEPQPFTVETVPRVGYRLVESSAAGPNGRVRKLLPVAAMLALALVLVAAGLLATREGGDALSVHITAGDETSTQLAADLLVKASELPPAMKAPVRLIGGDEPGRRGGLLLEVRGGAGDGASMLLKRSDGETLWASQFSASVQSRDLLTQRLAYAVGQLLECVGEVASEDEAYDRVLQLYVNACVALADSQQDIGKVVAMLGQVVAIAPRFSAGWAKYLQAETNALNDSDYPEDQTVRAALRRHSDAAEAIDRDIAQIYVARYHLTPPSQYQQRADLLDRAVALEPNKAFSREARSAFLHNVGFLNLALIEARRAVRLDPTSPATRSTYVLALAFSGKLRAAMEELAAAERIWPEAASLMQARYLIELRYGDPNDALRLLRSGVTESRGSQFQELLLEARIDPSAAKVRRAIDGARLAYQDEPRAIFGYLQTLAEFGRTDQIFEILLAWPEGYLIDHVTDVLFRPTFAEVHADPRFMQVADRLGLVAYWRTSGRWPDFCKSAALPYDCEEAARRLRG